MAAKIVPLLFVLILFNGSSKAQSVDVFYDWLNNSGREDSIRNCHLGRMWNQQGQSALNPQALMAIREAWGPRVGAAATMNYIAARARIMQELCPEVW
jgi:hypothetical protein